MNKKHLIVCEPTSGLMSRIYVLADAYELARRYGHQLVIIWQKTSDCDCTYEDVFDAKQFNDVPHRIYCCNKFEYKLKELKENHTPRNFFLAVKEVLLRVKFFFRYGFLKKYYQSRCNVHKNSYLDGNALFDEQKARGNSCYFECYNCITGKRDLTAVRFKQKDYETAERILQGHEAHCVGVHIRRTDHAPAISGSPTELFVAKMRQILAEDPEMFFFLATDDWEEQKELKKIFGNRILTQPQKILSRSSREGMRSSLIDMLCLSRTRYILGSYTSMFSKFSAEYGKIELKIMGE